jgi:peptide/nickel transport system substrate-binding protein
MKSRFLYSAALSAFLLTGTAYADTPGNTLVVAKAIDDIITLDPAANYEHSGTELINNVYEQLMQFEPEDITKLVGGAIESWTVSADGKTFELKLRPGQVFHSGNPMTSDDVVYSLQRMVKMNRRRHSPSRSSVGPGTISRSWSWHATQ